VSEATRIDLYQLTSLVTHHRAGHTDDRVVMTFFSRRLPKRDHDGAPIRGFLLFAGLRRCLEHLERARFVGSSLDVLAAHPVLGPNLDPDLLARLRDWRFRGTVRAPREGSVLYAGPAIRLDGTKLEANGVAPSAYAPYLEVETDLLSAKLIETPLLSWINHQTMVASKAARIVRAASGKTVLEFGTRRTHPDAAVDAAYAAHLAGVAQTSNVEAHVRYGVPMGGTMDHFAIQAWEQPGTPLHETEEAFFRAYHLDYPRSDILLVDTYDTFGAQTGIRAAVRATGSGPRGIRIDSNVSVETVLRARALLDELGAAGTRIYVSGGLDEALIRELRATNACDGFGVGERIVTSPDAPVGVGAVAKLSEVRGQPTMKLSRGSGKATLPGRLQVWRSAAGDLVGLAGAEHPGEPLLDVVFDADGPRPSPSLAEVRAHAKAGLDALPDHAFERADVALRVSDPLAALVERLASG
jgi:nicotinate phosphoribosyltransferase